MRIRAATAMTLAMAASGWGGEKIQVYVRGGYVAPAVLVAAENTASRMFEAVGVQIVWCFGAPRPGKSAGKQPAIVVEFRDHTSPYDHPGAMANARPYEGVHIVVLYDRMLEVPNRLLPVLLAHVLVHELTHLLEAVAHHSTTGVMKAQWDLSDYSRMLRAPLPFAAEDIELIGRGIEAREARANSALPAAAATSGQELPL